ncbi:molybdate ABC transporter substrate-binding protein [Nocardioides ganghwensis]|uniref:Molybdate ABC transporter substrate-binding protein n=1 Tax=Nocardioides ganghwensis TaxID=252230 RepID=A0A4Q2SCX4_9ACTN|nr:molybdate ABC transporter substrate-binding protein [Nocardioides ganghwensis]RYC00122.1 molybdate ABC transporter substrate-binding protein [Nocardioides ganghwensis]
MAACGGDDDEQTLTVLAAASLTGTFTELATTFEDEHPGVDVVVVLGSSTTLAEQAVDGAPGDVLATADARAMEVAVDGGAASLEPEAFALNELVIVTPPGNPADVTGLGSLASPGVDWARCVTSAPCGALAETVLDVRASQAEPVTEEVDVKAVLARVVAGEVDAGLVYRTDALAAGDDVETVETGQGAASTIYEITTLGGSALASDFVELVRSPEGQAVLRDAGFDAPRIFGDGQ